MTTASRLFAIFLLLASVFMTAWGAFGLTEYFTGVAVIPLQNPLFPTGMQFLHFFAIFGSGAIFLVGYATRWPGTPLAMVTACAVLAALCAVQTLDYLENGNRFILFALELTNYVIIGLFLFHSDRMRRHFNLDGGYTEAAA